MEQIFCCTLNTCCRHIPWYFFSTHYYQWQPVRCIGMFRMPMHLNMVRLLYNLCKWWCPVHSNPFFSVLVLVTQVLVVSGLMQSWLHHSADEDGLPFTLVTQSTWKIAFFRSNQHPVVMTYMHTHLSSKPAPRTHFYHGGNVINNEWKKELAQ